MKKLVLAVVISLFFTLSFYAQDGKAEAAIRKVMDEQAVAWNRYGG